MKFICGNQDTPMQPMPEKLGASASLLLPSLAGLLFLNDGLTKSTAGYVDRRNQISCWMILFGKLT